MVFVLGKGAQYDQASGILEGWGCFVKESGLECTSKNVASGRTTLGPNHSAGANLPPICKGMGMCACGVEGGGSGRKPTKAMTEGSRRFVWPR